MDLFFEVWLYLKNDFHLWRIFKISMDEGVEFRIFSGDDLAVIVKAELDQLEWAYLTAASHLIDWAERNYHASSSTRRGDSSWTEKLIEQLGGLDEIYNAKERW